MRSIILVVLVIICKQVTAQFQPTPTQFDKFINQPSIEWAAYEYDKVVSEKINLNKLLVLRFARNKIKASLPLIAGGTNANGFFYLSKKVIDKEILCAHCDESGMIFDSLGNGFSVKVQKEPFKIDTSVTSATNITEILYIENGELKSYIPWVSPNVIPITTSEGVALGISDYFSTCFNFKYNFQSSKQNKISFLTQTQKTIKLDTIDTENNLKELYGRNLIETLWPYVLKNKYPVYLTENNKKIKADEITSDLIEKLMVPIYDSLGNETGKFVREPLMPQNFTTAELQQDWYYDYTTNIVYNKIKSLTLYAKKWKKDINTPFPILKIVFN